MPDAEEMGRQAAAATEKASETAKGVKESVVSVAGEAAETIKSAVMDSDGDQADHDEL